MSGGKHSTVSLDPAAVFLCGSFLSLWDIYFFYRQATKAHKEFCFDSLPLLLPKYGTGLIFVFVERIYKSLHGADKLSVEYHF